MLRRTLLALLGFCLLVLMVTVGYAVIGLSGPETLVDEAEAQIAADEIGAAIKSLNQAERSLGPSGHDELRRRLLLLRSKAYLQLESHHHALADLQLLVDHHDPDLDLIRDYIRVLILDGSAGAGLRRAREELRQHPDDARLLELAGEATQALYQEAFAELLGELGHKLPPQELEQALAALRLFLYRKPNDSVGSNGYREFERILVESPTAVYVAGAFRPDANRIQSMIQQSKRYFTRSMAQPGVPVAAYQGLARALREADRDDDVVGLSEAYLRCFDHIYTTAAAINIARAHERAGRNRAVVDLADRFLPPGSWRERWQAGQLGDDVRHLLLCKARALHALGRKADLQQLVATVDEMSPADSNGVPLADAPLMLWPERALICAYERDLANDPGGVEQLLAQFANLREVRQPPSPEEDYLAEAMRLRLAVAEARGAGVGRYDYLLRHWSTCRPNLAEPHERWARVLLKFGHLDEAFLEASTNLQAAGHDDRALELFTAVADAKFSKLDRGAEGLLKRTVQLGRLPADFADPALYLSLAQLALDRELFDVALEASRRGAQMFNWAVWPRHLWARAAMATGNPEHAVQILEGVRTSHGDDSETLSLLALARLAAGQSTDDLIYDIAQTDTLDRHVAASLLENCLRRNDLGNARRVMIKVGAAFRSDPEIIGLVSDTLSRSGQNLQATQVLQVALPAIAKSDPAAAGPLAARYLLLQVRTGGQAIREATQMARSLNWANSAALFQLARQLAELRRPGLAAALLHPLLYNPDHEPFRSGDLYILAGRVELALGDLDEAERHFIRALTFPERDQVSTPLAMLLLRQGRKDEAIEAFWAQRATDRASAALLLRLGKPQATELWIRDALARDISNLPVLCLFFLLHGVDKAPPEIRELIDNCPELLLDVLGYPEVPGFESYGLQLAKQLLDRYPGNTVTRYLWYHALAMNGQDTEAIVGLSQLAHERRSAAAYDELLRVLADTSPAALDNPELLRQVVSLVKVDDKFASPRLRAYVLSALVTGKAGAQFPAEAAVDALAYLYTNYTLETHAGFAEVDGLIALHRYHDAITLLDNIQRQLAAKDQGAFAALFGNKARAIAAATADPDVYQALLQRARVLMDHYGPYGSLVHFVLAERDHRLGPVPRSEDQRKKPEIAARIEHDRRLLDGHLDHFLRGEATDANMLMLTLRRLRSIETRPAMLARTEELLRFDPSLLRVWRLRAELLESEHRPAEAAASLVWIFRYTDAPMVVVDHARIAAEAGFASAADDHRLITQLDAATSARPVAALARGLVAYRMARYDEADALLAEAAPRPGGTHLYFRALANLSIPGPRAGARAAALLRKVNKKYRWGPHSTLAGFLPQQLERPPH